MSNRQQKFPVTLGKPSLRRRLEAYYRLVAPSLVAIETSKLGNPAWLARFDMIWEKFGGSYQGEAKLAAKLANKYGSTVRLLTASAPGSTLNTNQLDCDSREEKPAVKPEEFFVLTDQQCRSGVLDFTSGIFDPNSALNGPSDRVVAINNWMATGDLLVMDRVDHCSCLLPASDPFYRPGRNSRILMPEQPKKRIPPKQPSFFQNFVTPFKDGPFSILHESMMLQYRIRVIIRYVNGIRGAMTGFVLSFDKHFNILLSGAEEVYSPRCGDKELSNVEMERQRRLGQLHAKGGALADAINLKGSLSCSVRRRRLLLSLIRGDNVVLVYKVSAFRPPSRAATSPASFIDEYPPNRSSIK